MSLILEDEPKTANPLHADKTRQANRSTVISRLQLESSERIVSADVPLRFSSFNRLTTATVIDRQSSFVPLLPVNSKYLSTFMLVNYMIGKRREEIRFHSILLLLIHICICICIYNYYYSYCFIL